MVKKKESIELKELKKINKRLDSIEEDIDICASNSNFGDWFLLMVVIFFSVWILIAMPSSDDINAVSEIEDLELKTEYCVALGYHGYLEGDHWYESWIGKCYNESGLEPYKYIYESRFNDWKEIRMLQEVS